MRHAEFASDLPAGSRASDPKASGFGDPETEAVDVGRPALVVCVEDADVIGAGSRQRHVETRIGSARDIIAGSEDAPF